MGRLKEDNRVIFKRFICTDFSQPLFPVSGDQSVLFLQVQGGHLSRGSFISCFLEGKGGHTAFYAPVVFLSAVSSK